MCPCGLVGIDGGIEAGNSILGNSKDILNLSTYKSADGILLEPSILERLMPEKCASEPRKGPKG